VAGGGLKKPIINLIAGVGNTEIVTVEVTEFA